MLWRADSYQAEVHKGCRRKASWRKGPFGLILNDDEGCLQSESNSNASYLSVEVHDVYLLCYPLCSVCNTPVTREVDSHLMPKSLPGHTWQMPSFEKGREQAHIFPWEYQYLDKGELLIMSGVLGRRRTGERGQVSFII